MPNAMKLQKMPTSSVIRSGLDSQPTGGDLTSFYGQSPTRSVLEAKLNALAKKFRAPLLFCPLTLFTWGGGADVKIS